MQTSRRTLRNVMLRISAAVAAESNVTSLKGLIGVPSALITASQRSSAALNVASSVASPIANCTAANAAPFSLERTRATISCCLARAASTMSLPVPPVPPMIRIFMTAIRLAATGQPRPWQNRGTSAAPDPAVRSTRRARLPVRPRATAQVAAPSRPDRHRHNGWAARVLRSSGRKMLTILRPDASGCGRTRRTDPLSQSGRCKIHAASSAPRSAPFLETRC